MDYEKAYKKALERAKKNYDVAQDLCNGSQIGVECFKNTLTNIFPELKESEDERIRKRLIDLIYKVYAFTNYITCVEYENIIAWLEKQGDTTSDIRYDGVNAGASLSVVNGNSFDYEKATITQKDFASVGETATIELSSPIDCGDRIYHVSHKPIEKQGEQKPAVTDFNAKDWYVSKVDGKIHDMTYNPTDKVEPKFKIGDYIVSDYCMGRVVEITSDAYLLDIGQGIPFSCKDNVHLWTIQDAKDGDVLIDKNYMGESPFIFKETKPSNIKTDVPNPLTVLGYCGIGGAGFTKSSGWGDTANCIYYPATKEQRELLFKKMNEAGYEWDAEKKELKLLITNGGDFEQKQEWSEEDKLIVESIEGALEGYEGMVSEDWEREKDWLKSLKDRVQPKQEWGEEDKNVLEDIKEAIINYWHGDTQDILLDWLKSLKDKIKA